ncbi:MAG: sensor histidine kinase, partial [Symbiobacteriaceae bacterium]
ELPPSVDTAAYRIIQEALTNTRKHAGPARASVRLSYTDDGIRMRIDDDGAGPSGDRDGGDGIPGMRERAALVGGRIDIHSRPGQGTRLRVWIPIDQEADGAGRPAEATAEGAWRSHA